MTKKNKTKCDSDDTFLDVKDCPEEEVGPDDDFPRSSPSKKDPCSNDLRDLGCLDSEHCYPWQLTDQTEEACIIEDYIEESITIGGAIINVHKMLGIYEQTKLIDEVGMGEAIASSEHPNFPAENAYDYYDTEWRSKETGNDVIKKSFLGYDFGPIRLDNGRLRYGIETFVKKNISTIKIKQGCESKNRATRIRVERSPDGKIWYGSSILTIPDCEGAVTIRFRSTSPARYWRIRPISFNGSKDDPWIIKAIILSENEITDQENIQDKIFLENRDREYAKEPIVTKASYSPVDYQGFLSKLGFNSPLNKEQFLLEFSFQQIIRLIGRPLVIGDILQLPSETFFSAKLRKTLKYLEITNVSWAAAGFTPHWVPTILRVIAEPAMASQETQDIFGDLTETSDELGTSDINDGMRNKKYQDHHDIDQTVVAEANTAVPQRGQDFANKSKLSDELKDWIQGNIPELNADKIDRKRKLWGVDGLPPNGEDYTEGDEFPDKPKDGDYHRLTYETVDQNIAPRLYRFSKEKKRWLYLETDRRFQSWTDTKPSLSEFLKKPIDEKYNRSDINEIGKNIDKSIDDSEEDG